MKVWVSRKADLEVYQVEGKTLRKVLLEIISQKLKANFELPPFEVRGYREDSRECISLPLDLDHPLPPDLSAISIEMNCSFQEAIPWLLKHYFK